MTEAASTGESIEPAKRKKRGATKAPAELAEHAHRLGIESALIWIPRKSMARLRQRLTFHVLTLMEDAYERTGFWPKDLESLRTYFAKKRLSSFPEIGETSGQDILASRRDARRRFLDWYLNRREDGSEQARVHRIKQHANKYMLNDVELIQTYRDTRNSIRRGQPAPTSDIRQHSLEFITLLARESADVPWRGGLK